MNDRTITKKEKAQIFLRAENTGILGNTCSSIFFWGLVVSYKNGSEDNDKEES